MKQKITKKIFLWILMPILSIGMVVVLTIAIANRPSSFFDKNDSLIPSIPDVPITPPEPDNSLKPSQIILYFKNENDLIREINNVYCSSLKYDLLKKVKLDIANSGILGIVVDVNSIDDYCEITLPNVLTIDNLNIETVIENDTYKLKSFKNLKVDINPKSGEGSMSIRVNLFDDNWNINFFKK